MMGMAFKMSPIGVGIAIILKFLYKLESEWELLAFLDQLSIDHFKNFNILSRANVVLT